MMQGNQHAMRRVGGMLGQLTRQAIRMLGVMSIVSIGLGIGMVAEAAPPAKEDTLLLQLKDGTVVIQLRPDLAPKHVERIKQLVREGFYDKVVFHRVIDGFMAQTGDPTGTGMGGSGQKLKAEFSEAAHTRGAVSMARGSDPGSADSQFFIVLADAPHLNRQYTVFGYVLDGMTYVDHIKKGDPARNGTVVNPDHILSARIAADVEQHPESTPEGAAGGMAPISMPAS